MSRMWSLRVILRQNLKVKQDVNPGDLDLTDLTIGCGNIYILIGHVDNAPVLLLKS